MKKYDDSIPLMVKKHRALPDDTCCFCGSYIGYGKECLIDRDDDRGIFCNRSCMNNFKRDIVYWQ